ncbi:MAG: DUF4177 domain-containing protein [Patescibacteria group bacterium]
MEWKYNCVYMPAETGEKMSRKLNELAKEGWELVNVIGDVTGHYNSSGDIVPETTGYTLFLKRPRS